MDPGAILPTPQLLPVHIAGIFLFHDLPFEPLVIRRARALIILGIGAFQNINTSSRRITSRIQCHRHDDGCAVGILNFHHENDVALAAMLRVGRIENGDGIGHSLRQLLPHVRRHVGVCAVKEVRRGVDPAPRRDLF